MYRIQIHIQRLKQFIIFTHLLIDKHAVDNLEPVPVFAVERF